jgi:hypothetical protein
LPPKKNLKLSSARQSRACGRGFLAAAGGEKCSNYFKYTEPSPETTALSGGFDFVFSCPPPVAAGKNPHSAFGGQQAGKNSFPLKPLSFLLACLAEPGKNFSDFTYPQMSPLTTDHLVSYHIVIC